MKAYRESTIREKCEPSAVRILDLWHSLCEEHLNFDVEVMIADRHECNQFKDYSGELNTAYPKKLNGEVKLILYMNSLKNVSPIVLTHELGHWIVKMQGFKAAIFRNNRHSDKEILLNSLCQHRAVYYLQRSFDINPQEEIDSRTNHNIKLFQCHNEPTDKNTITNNALLLADDLLSCSSDKSDKLINIILDKHKHTHPIIDKILDIAPHYDLLNNEKCMRFERMLIQKLKLSRDWCFANEIPELKKMNK